MCDFDIFMDTILGFIHPRRCLAYNTWLEIGKIIHALYDDNFQGLACWIRFTQSCRHQLRKNYLPQHLAGDLETTCYLKYDGFAYTNRIIDTRILVHIAFKDGGEKCKQFLDQSPYILIFA